MQHVCTPSEHMSACFTLICHVAVILRLTRDEAVDSRVTLAGSSLTLARDTLSPIVCLTLAPGLI